MARPFPTTFDKDSPMTPQSATANISYQTNVNRQKTKKWTEARTVNYGGDDWGEDDEYGYEPPPPPVPKSTGLRQPGQAAQSSSNIGSPFTDSSKKYGDLPPLPGPSGGRGRANSFDADDEKRNFSNATVRQPSLQRAQGPATRFSQITGVPTIRNPAGPPALHISTEQPTQSQPAPPRQINPVTTPVTGSPHPEVLMAGPPGRVNMGESGSVVSPVSDLVTPSTASDYHARRDYSPSAVPPPLSTRASPGPQSAGEIASTAKFPARKSSLSQSMGPPVGQIMQAPAEQSAPKQYIAGQEPSPENSSRSPTTPTEKALPFIRPADIYRRRMEEEKERQSLESSRPSLDSIMGTQSKEGLDPPGTTQPRRESSSEGLGAAYRRGSGTQGEEPLDSGRRLMPVLEPVKERKSEYGFEGIDVNEPALNTLGQSTAVSQEPSMDRLDVEEVRRQSTSPKLPDLNRISGFGMDIFSPSDSSLYTESEITPTTVSASHDPSANDEGLSLRTQPSIGFRSVVNQAFDTSVPPTPASRSGSGVRRTDSESTGTAGVSPIMSRVPSSVVPGSRVPDSTPSIPEVANEPTSPEVEDEITYDSRDGREVPGLKLGHRRDISTPSPGNSPARTPDLNTASHIITAGQHADVSLASPEVLSPSDDEPLQAPRPLADRENSFRPNLPGGWTSYATTARSESPAGLVEDNQAPVNASLETETPSEDFDLTPTTIKQPLLQTEFGAAVAGAAVIGSTGAAFSRHEKASPIDTSLSNSPKQMTTPDLTMASGGNIYSANTLDSRVPPNSEEAPTEVQLRPDAVGKVISDESSAAPIPPPKDTPVMSLIENGEFPSQKAPIQQEFHQAEPWQNHESSLTPEDLSTSPDNHSYDEENDKLQKEIVESLTRQPSTVTRQDKHSLSDQVENSNSRGQGRESTYLPQEYDNYWASTTDDGKELPGTSEAAQPAVQAPIIAPLSPRRDEQASLVPPRPELQSRFSWEGETENAVASPPPPANHDPSSFAPEVVRPPVASLLGATEFEAPNSLSELEALPNKEIPSTSVVPSTLDHRAEDSSAPYASVNPIGSGAGVFAGAAALGGIYELAHDRPGQSDHRLSLAEEKGHMVSSYAVSPTPPEDEHPARSPKPYLPLSTDHNSDPRAPSTVSPVDTPVQQVSPTAGKPIAFKDIVAINSPKQRIQVFNETRQHWATIDTGLNDWMVRLQGQYPEHAGTTGAWSGSRMSAPIGSARSKFSKPAGPAPPLQQPYYQQYLNASSPANPSTPTNPGPGPGPGPSFQTNTQQNFAPPGNKLTSHQVQTKGKEFLHTAGIFGGKAGKAGKGLLAKGKNKFRGSGGDKSPPPKPKSERRSSWGLPLNMTRSSNRHDGSSRHSKDSTPTPTIQHSRAATTTSWEAMPALENPTSDDSREGVSGARVSEDILRPPTPVTPTTIRQITQDQHPEPSRQLQDDDAVSDLDDRDALAIPAPISNSQPSLDAFNAAPITEEALQDEMPPNERQLSLESQKPVSSLSVPVDVFSKSERSNSDDAHFYDASEEPSEINNDWVMVSPNQESKETLSQDDPVIVARDEQQVELELPKPVVSPTTSIINRPRGSSYEVPLPPTSAKSQTIAAASPPASSFTPSKMTASFIAPAPQISTPEGNVRALPANLSQTEADKSSSTTSFLPPIRRTSTFGLGFGSRKVKPRFAIEDEDNETTSPDLQPTSVVPTTVQNFMSLQSTASEERHVPKTEEIHNIPSAEHQEFQQASPPRSLPHSQPTTETLLVRNQPFPTSNVYNQANQKSIEQSGSSRGAAVRQFQGPTWANRPPLTQGGSSSAGQRNMLVLRDSPQPPVSHPRAGDVLQRPELRESQVEWRPNRPKATPAPALPITSSDWKEMDLPPPRNSWDPQSERELSAPPQIKNLGQEEEYDEKPSRTVPTVQQRPYEQPPSSAQRYPELFRPGQTGTDVPRGSIDLPAQYYQAPIPRGAAFLPRQQTNEYQLPGVGPPEPPHSSGTRRNSGFLRDIVSRTSSRERRSNSISRDQTLSRGNEYADSIAPSEGAQDRQRKRSSFFGALHHGSTSGLGTPASRESVIAHNSASTTDLVVTPPSQPSSVLRQERKKSLFSGSHLADPRSKPKKLERASTGTTGTNESSKKNRFSGLGGLFSKSSQSIKATVEPHPQATRELSQHERQPLESPLLIPAKSSKPPAVAKQTRSLSQSQNVLSKLTHSNTSNSSPLKESKPRRSSASGLLNGFMGRKTNGTERGSDDSRSQGSASQLGQQPVLLSQTYTDLRQQEQALVTPPTQVQPPAKGRPSAQIQGLPVENRAVSTPERGRRTNREPAPYVEPQYDSVPIPSGYSLVRGDGSLLAESTYDPRGLGRPQYAPSPIHGTYSNIIPSQPQTLAYGSGQQHLASRSQQSYPAMVQQNRQPNQQKPTLNALETYQSYTSHARRLSREDLLARSPPKSIEGQQRPYQISLPGGDDDDDDDEDERPVPLQKNPIAQSPHAPAIKQSKNDPIQRLQQPTLRHPASPAGYPLPDDTVFSPVNPGANDIPPPPPPKWPSHLDNQHGMGHERQESLTQSMSTMDIDLDRSDTRRTAVSAVSGFSGPPAQSGLNVPGKDDANFDIGRSDSVHGGARGLNMSSPSPSPPSPMRTPQRGVSPEGNTISDDIRTTEVRLLSGHEEDLYNASPRLPKPVPTNGNGNASHYHPNGSASSVPLSDGKENQKFKGIATQFPKTYFDPRVPEEKIPTHTQNQLDTQEDEPVATMSATSYPGQEWNPYAGAGWDEGDD